MADQLASPEDLASLLELDWATLPAATKNRLTLLVECATAVVQAAADGQRIVAASSTATLDGGPGRWLWLPQIPVRSVTAVSLDGTALAAGDYRLRGHRLWRAYGWQTVCSPPPEVEVTYEHGHETGAQELQRARQATLSLAAPLVDNSAGQVRVQIDDYAAAYEAMSARMEESPHLRRALLRQYGRSAGLVMVGES